MTIINSLVQPNTVLMAAKEMGMLSMVIMVLIVGDEAIYSKLSSLECEIFMQILPQSTLLPSRKPLL